MQKIGTYSAYQNNVYERASQTSKSGRSTGITDAKKAGEVKENKTPTLSKAAQNLLKDLKKTYKDMDFIVADYETEEEAAEYLSRGTSEYSALLTSDELEKMAADESVKEKNLKILDEAKSKLDDMKKELGDKGEDVTRLGIVFGEDGEVSFFAELEKGSAKQRERIEKQREENKESAKEAKKAEGEEQRGASAVKPGGKRTTVFASSVEELAKKIGQIDWDNIKGDSQGPVGAHFNLTV